MALRLVQFLMKQCGRAALVLRVMVSSYLHHGGIVRIDSALLGIVRCLITNNIHHQFRDSPS